MIGMHRSGTSVVTRIVNLLGVSLGPEHELLAAAPHNPAGFWENRHVVALNDDLLEALGGNATTPPVLTDGWEHAPGLEPFHARASRLVTSISNGARLVGWKDPRMSITLPFWRTVTPVTHVVHCLRNPLEAAPSLARWQPFDLERAGELWLRYVVSACRTAQEQLLVPFDEVLARPEAVARRIAAALDLPAPEPDLLAEVRGFVDSKLYRFRGPAEPADGTLALAATLYRLLVDGGLSAGLPVAELMQRLWLTEDNVLRTSRAVEELQERIAAAAAAQGELASAERALRTRLSVRTALRLAQPAGPVMRRLRRR